MFFCVAISISINAKPVLYKAGLLNGVINFGVYLLIVSFVMCLHPYKKMLLEWLKRLRSE